MEQEFFDWEDWENEGNLMIFHNATLTKELGEHKIGDKFPVIVWSIETGIFEIQKNDKVLSTHQMVLCEK